MAEYKQLIGLSRNMAGTLIATPSPSGGILFDYILPGLGVAGVAAGAGLGLYYLMNSNNPDRMNSNISTDAIIEPKPDYNNIEFEKNRPNLKNPTLLQRGTKWGSDTGYLVKCVLQDWFSTQSPECAAFRQRAKNDNGIYNWFTKLAWWTKSLLLGGVSLVVIVPLLKWYFNRYAESGETTLITPEIKPDIKPDFKNENKSEIKPNINTEIKPEIKPNINPEINPQFNLDYEPNYDPDYNPNLLQNYVPTINVNTAKQPAPQIVIQPKGTVFVPYEEGKKFTRKLHNEYDWLFE